MKPGSRKNKIRQLGVREAAIYSVFINVLIYLFVFIMFQYGRSAIIPIEAERPAHPPMTEWMLLYGAATSYLYVFLLFYLNFYILKLERLPGKSRIALAVIVSVVYILFFNRLFLYIQTGLFDIPRPDFRMVRGLVVKDVVLGGFVIFSSQLMYADYRRKLIIVENESLKAEYERARYEALKNQVDPHFLFNTLNTINSIIVKNPPQAQDYIQKLSSIFRYTLHGRDATTLAEELAFTKDYCDLMKIRYGDNISFDFDISPRYNSYSVVPFSIQTLVENAIKHNVISDRHRLTVSISTDADDYVTVSNPLHPKKEHEAGEGVGLANLSERYRLKWRKDIVVSDDGITFRVRLPLVNCVENSYSIEL